ncbi:MAG: DegV family protein [Chloroflexi bacterium]|jgi:DegV family protein with EDD domain|nr:DegV family protein [Chloroflexota bacterium]
MKRIAIITDSTSDLPAEIVERYGIIVVPLYVVWGEEQLRDGVDIDHATFYARLPDDPIHPKTSQPSPQDFAQAIEQSGADEAVILTISSALSGTMNAAEGARALVDVPVHVVDSRAVSMGLGWQVIMAARALERGGDAQAMIAAAASVRERLTMRFVLDTLEYLHRGGRIGGAARFLGTMLQLKPLLAIDQKSGMIEAVERTRTRQRAVRRLLEVAFERIDLQQPIRVAVLHTACLDEMLALRDEIADRYHPVEILCSELGPVLGVHGGAGLLGIGVFNDPE